MKVRIPIRFLGIEGDGYHLAVKMKINGKSANAILDTGASKTVFDKTRIGHFLGKEKFSLNEQLSTGLGTTTMQSHVVELMMISLGKIVIQNYQAVVLDLSHVNETYHKLGLPKIDGVIGSDIFHRYKAVIDYEKKILWLREVKKVKKKK
ncbi:MAG: clan AA aspartic protease [Bacteroidetes bacterium]|nr:clan AA aspartic protease [Bacteroidota bacterium]